MSTDEEKEENYKKPLPGQAPTFNYLSDPTSDEAQTKIEKDHADYDAAKNSLREGDVHVIAGKDHKTTYRNAAAVSSEHNSVHGTDFVADNQNKVVSGQVGNIQSHASQDAASGVVYGDKPVDLSQRDKEKEFNKKGNETVAKETKTEMTVNQSQAAGENGSQSQPENKREKIKDQVNAPQPTVTEPKIQGKVNEAETKLSNDAVGQGIAKDSKVQTKVNEEEAKLSGGPENQETKTQGEPKIQKQVEKEQPAPAQEQPPAQSETVNNAPEQEGHKR